jgi:hypothetical protein
MSTVQGLFHRSKVKRFGLEGGSDRLVSMTATTVLIEMMFD